MVSVQQKVALVTGAARHIGREIALAMAGRGWDVVVHFRTSEAEALKTVNDIEQLGRRAVALYCDLQDAAAVQSLLPLATEALGPVSCVVNNASLFELDSVQDFAVSALDAHMHINLAAPILLTRALHQATPEGAQSVVVNLLDQKLANLNPSYLSYTLSKAALETATKTMAQELGPKLRVVGVAPGLTTRPPNHSEEEFALAHTVSPLGRASLPEDVAAAVCFLAESPAITGTTLFVDGGQHLVPMREDVMFAAQTFLQQKES